MKFSLKPVKGISHAHSVECITTEDTYSFTDCILVQQKDSDTLTIIERPGYEVSENEEVPMYATPGMQHAIGMEFCVKMTILRDIEHAVWIDETFSLWRLDNEEWLSGEDSRPSLADVAREAKPKA